MKPSDDHSVLQHQLERQRKIMLEVVDAQEKRERGLSSALTDGLADLQAARDRIAALQLVIDGLQDENSRIVAENVEFKEITEQMRSSRSWRITGPVRSVGDAIRRG